MAIRVVRNDAGNCVNFVGTSNPTYWNACLSAEINATNNNNINIINDVRTSTSEEVIYEFLTYLSQTLLIQMVTYSQTLKLLLII